MAVVVGTLVLAGCQSKAKSNPDQQSEAKQSVEKRLPAAKVGVVSATLPDKGLVAVEQVDLTKFYVGDTLVFTDVNLKIIAAGTVVAKTDKALHVKYDVKEDGRAPRIGDIAIQPQK